MEMCYDGALVMPSNYAVMSEDEMMYVDGGALTKVQKGLIIAGVVAAGVAFAVALAYGQVWLGLKFAKAIFGKALRAVMVKNAGTVITLIATCIASSFGISAAATTATIKWIIKKF